MSSCRNVEVEEVRCRGGIGRLGENVCVKDGMEILGLQPE